jgi:hypothetical protein
VTSEIHVVQALDGPILIGSGDGMFSCTCGNPLIEGFRPQQFLAIGIQCARCEAVTTTPPLAAGETPPRTMMVMEPSATPRTSPMTVPSHVAAVGRTEMDRLGTLFRPATPPDTAYQITGALLDQAADAFEGYLGHELPEIPPDPANVYAGLRDHALAWAVRHLRVRMQAGAWSCVEDTPTASAVVHVTGFLHFVATWSHHPLFPAMAATADTRGFSIHGLALFAAAHSMAVTGNRVGFQPPTGYPGHIESFDLATGATEVVAVQLEVFDRFELPFGRPWDYASLSAAVSEAVAAAQGRINLRNPGVLLLSPGAAVTGYDEAMFEAVKAAMQSLGRKNRGLMAVAPIVLRVQPMPDPHTVRIGYGLFPVNNRHYSGSGLVQTGG